MTASLRRMLGPRALTPTPSRRSVLRSGTASALSAMLAPALGHAGPEATLWPSRPLRLVLAYPAGGVSDTVARSLAALLAERLRQPVLVDHRPGAGGALALEQLQRSPPDGHTLCFCATSALTLSPLLRAAADDSPRRADAPDPLHGVSPVIPVMATPVLVLGTPALRARTLEEALSLARAQPGRLRWATSGLGTTGHLVLEQIAVAAGVALTHVPYKGGGQQLNDALAGHFELLSSNVAATQLQHVRRGRLQALAVGAPTRLAVLPQVRTLVEAGYPQANLTSLFGIFASGRTPPPLVERINREIDAVLQSPALRRQLEDVDNLPMGGSAEAFAQRLSQEREAHRRYWR